MPTLVVVIVIITNITKQYTAEKEIIGVLILLIILMIFSKIYFVKKIKRNKFSNETIRPEKDLASKNKGAKIYL